jgi:hypothetical protein
MSLALLAPALRAQIETFNTIVAYNTVENYGFTGGTTALTQTFQDVAELNSVTYQFVQTGTLSSDQTINAYLVQWNTTTYAPESTFTTEATPGDPTSDVTNAESSTPFETFTVPPATGDANGTWSTATASGGGTYQAFNVQLSINQILDPNLTYGIVLIDTTITNTNPLNGPITSGSGLGLPGVITSSNSFAGYGTGLVDADPVSTLTAMENDPNENANNAITGPSHGATAGDETYGFSQIALVPGGNVVPTPEPRTAALALCGLFVAFLVGRQIYLNRKSQDLLAGATLA